MSLRQLYFIINSTILILSTLNANSQVYPIKTIRMLVPLSAGGPTDTLARLIAHPLSEKLGQTIVIDNRPGAAGNIASEMVAKAPPDGYTLFMAGAGSLAINVSLFKTLPYHPIRDFSPITLISSAPFVVTVHPTLPVSSLQSLVALAKKKPGQLSYGAVTGNAAHLATELFNSVSGIKVTHIPYKGAAPATMDLISGQIQISFASTYGALQYMRVNKLKALAVTSATRLSQLPQLPTVDESGYPNYEATTWIGLVAPVKTPREIIERLNKEIASIIKQPINRDRILAADFAPISTTPEEFGTFIKSEIEKWSSVVKASGASAD